MDEARRSVWVVDDSPLDGSRAAAALRTKYEVELFADGSAVLEQLAGRTAPDVLVLDWVMPGISGVDVCRFIRDSRTEAAESVAILLLTGHQATEQIVEGLSAGANDHLSKPYAEAELLARVDVLVRSRQLLARVENAERAVRLLLDNSPDALLVLDKAGRVSYANAEAERVVGVSAPGLRGVEAESLVPGLADWSASEDRPSSFALPDVTIKDQVYAPVVRHLHEDQDAGVATIALRNVTAHRQREAERLDFYAIVAHDLRSPLNVISLRTEMLLSGARGALGDRAAADLRSIHKNAGGMVDLINDFLEFARLDSASYTMVQKPLDLAALFCGVVEDLRPLLDAANHRFDLSVPKMAFVVGDRARLAQVLVNLLTNAVKYTPAGGRVSGSVRSTDGSVEVAIADDGPGIDQTMLSKVTDRYVRGNAPGAPGTGLGLMIVRQILEAHCSTLRIESTVGRGSRFSFRLPEAPHPDGAASP